MKIEIELNTNQQSLMQAYAEATFGGNAVALTDHEFNKVCALRALLGEELRRSALHAFCAAGHYHLPTSTTFQEQPIDEN